MRCPDCNKFVSYAEPEAELNSADISGDTLNVDVDVKLNCSECGTELKSCNFTTEAHLEAHECQSPEAELAEDREKFEIDEEGEPFGDSRTQTKDRNGKPIKLARYMKTFYGFTMQTSIKCNCCEEIFTVETQDEAQASSFDEVC